MKTVGHLDNYNQFRESYADNVAEGEGRIKPAAQDALLMCFHLIEAVLARDGLHVHKHQLLPRFLRETDRITVFTTEERKDLAELYQELERMRPGLVYGGKENGEALAKIKSIVDKIEAICLPRLG